MKCCCTHAWYLTLLHVTYVTWHTLLSTVHRKLATSEGRDALILPGKNPRLAGFKVRREAALAALHWWQLDQLSEHRPCHVTYGLPLLKQVQYSDATHLVIIWPSPNRWQIPRKFRKISFVIDVCGVCISATCSTALLNLHPTQSWCVLARTFVNSKTVATHDHHVRCWGELWVFWRARQWR